MGGCHGVLSVFERAVENKINKIHSALRWMITFFIVSILWLLFRTDSIFQWAEILKRIFSFENTSVSQGLIDSFINPESDLLLHLLRFPNANDSIRGFWMLVYFAFGVCVSLGFENSFRRKNANNIFTAVGFAFIFVFSLTCLGGEAVFVYNNF